MRALDFILRELPGYSTRRGDFLYCSCRDEEVELRVWEDHDGQNSWDSILERRELHREKPLEISKGSYE